MNATSPVEMILERMTQIRMTRADLVRSSGIGRQQIDRYFAGTVAPSVTAWARLLNAVGLEIDTRPTAAWMRAERAERGSRRAQELEMQGATRDPLSVTTELFLSERLS